MENIKGLLDPPILTLKSGGGGDPAISETSADEHKFKGLLTPMKQPGKYIFRNFKREYAMKIFPGMLMARLSWCFGNTHRIIRRVLF